MEKSKNKKESSSILNVVGVIIFCLVAYIFIPQIFQSDEKISRLREELVKTEEKIVSEQKKLVELKANIEKLDDTFYKEKLVRKRLRMVKDGEIIYKLLD